MAAEKENQSRSKQSAKDQEKEPKTRSQKSTSAKGKSNESKLAAGKSARTTDHDTIRRWVEERGGSPAAVKATESKNDPGMLRINFPGYSGEGRLEDISWDEFFKKFDEKKLEFLYQDKTRDGETSRFWKFVSRGSDKK